MLRLGILEYPPVNVLLIQYPVASMLLPGLDSHGVKVPGGGGSGGSGGVGPGGGSGEGAGNLYDI